MDTVFRLYLIERVWLYVKIVKKVGSVLGKFGLTLLHTILWTWLLFSNVVTLLPLVQQGPTNGLIRGISTLSSIVPLPGLRVWPSAAKLGLVLGGQ